MTISGQNPSNSLEAAMPATTVQNDESTLQRAQDVTPDTTLPPQDSFPPTPFDTIYASNNEAITRTL